MAQHDLIAILPGQHELPTDLGTISVQAGGFMAILSAEPVPTLRLPTDRKTALRQAVTRQTVLERLMAWGTVLPALPRQPLSRAAAHIMLQANAYLLAEWQAAFDDLVQFQITIDWNLKDVLHRFRDAPEIGPLFSAQRTTPHQIETAVHALRERLAGEIQGNLATVSRDMHVLPNHPETLVSVAILIETNASAHLDQIIETIDAIWTDGLRIRQIGPAPAASFVSLTVTEVTPLHLQEARAMLGCPVDATPEQIISCKKQRLRQSDTVGADRLRHAADILSAAARLPDPTACFPLLKRWSEGTSVAQGRARQVA